MSTKVLDNGYFRKELINMLENTKRQLGYLKRGIFGFVWDNIEKVPDILPSIYSFQIGESVQKKPIICFQIGNGSRNILYVAGIHGNEVGTIKLARHFINWAHANANLLKNYSLFIIPCLNPDSYKLAQKNPQYFGGGRIGRFNANNVDLNRNFNTPNFKTKSIWSFGKNFSETQEVYCGKYGNSEPEIKRLTNFIITNKIKVLFMFHNAGASVMGNRNKLSQELTKMYCAKTGFNYISEAEWVVLKQTGTAKEWCDINNIAYIEVEGSTRWGSDWKKQKKAIETTILLA